MTCILRAGGPDLVVDDLLRAIRLKPYRIDRRGERHFAKVHSETVVHFDVSNRELADLGGAIADAVAFLEANEQDVRQLCTFPGVTNPVLDFGTRLGDGVAQFDRIPAKLARLAGNLGLDLEISHYLVSDAGQENGAHA